MPLYLEYKIPHFCAAVGVLETECIVHAVRFRPDDERV